MEEKEYTGFWAVIHAYAKRLKPPKWTWGSMFVRLLVLVILLFLIKTFLGPSAGL